MSSSPTKLRPLSAAAVKAMLGDGKELALIDVREELIYSRNHLLWARSVPLSRLALQFARLVPRRSTRIVLCDDGDGLVERAAAILAGAGYSDLSSLEGGIAAWERAGFILFSGMNVPSKAFGEFIEHQRGTPSISADELDEWMREGRDIAILDSRPFDEFSRISIPRGINVPGAELVLRARDMAPSPDTMIVVNCAGRTRSIMGAQSLIDAGVPNKVVALRNGTMGWHLAGLACANGASARYPDVSTQGLAWSQEAAQRVAEKAGVRIIDRAALQALRADTTRTTYVFDVRDPQDYARGHFPGAVSAPGGQLIQATDTYVGTLHARVVLCDDRKVRALMTAAWLRQMGWDEVFVLPEAGEETDAPKVEILGTPNMDAAIDAEELAAQKDATVLDLSRSPNYAKGHFPGAWFAIAGRLDRALAKIPLRSTLVLTSEDDVLASLTVEEARVLTKAPVRWLKGGNAAWVAAGHALSRDPLMGDEPVDAWLKPYERAGDPKNAMNEYLAWEVDLLERIKQDGTCNFLGA